MSRRRFFQMLVVAAAAACVLVLSGVLSAQGNSGNAFERVKEVQERHTKKLMAKEGIVGTAVGLDENGKHAVLVLLERPGVSGIPTDLEGVPVRPVVTGKIYALKPPGGSPPGQDKKPPKDRTPPAVPTGLTAEAVSSSAIDLDWASNTDPDLSHYNVYRSTAAAGPYRRIESNVEVSEYTDTGLASSTTYHYTVTAVDTSGNESDKCDPVSATTPAGTVEPPLWDRPIPIGVSTGHPDITAGTIGCRVSIGSVLYALSNNHVYANENKASIGDNVLAPGTYDGGMDPRDRIGTLADFVPIEFGPFGTNLVDAAIAKLDEADYDDNGTLDGPSVDNATPELGYGTPSSTAAGATLGLAVQKYGRTTGLTHGTVDGLNATVRVRYSSGFAIFMSQIIITPGDFSAGGDSGSLIVTDDEHCNPVGLLFAGSSTMTVANPVGEVLSQLGVSIDGK